jgi:hypothetical protein
MDMHCLQCGSGSSFYLNTDTGPNPESQSMRIQILVRLCRQWKVEFYIKFGSMSEVRQLLIFVNNSGQNNYYIPPNFAYKNFYFSSQTWPPMPLIWKNKHTYNIIKYNDYRPHSPITTKLPVTKVLSETRQKIAYATVLRIRDVYPFKLIYYNSLLLVKWFLIDYSNEFTPSWQFS